MPIFQDANGLAVKFFIQKDLAPEIQAELCETITSLGGRVESKVPRVGFVLVQPGTAEEERLRLCWLTADRPERHFVPYTYVEACKIEGQLLKQIFTHKGEPMKFHIHPSIANPNARQALSQRIQHSGGDPTASQQSARVILADPATDVFENLVGSYQGVPEKYIESYLWVKKCIENNVVEFTPVVYKNPGGRRPGEERMQFTPQDEERLCNWIATKIPYKETGGRTGNRLYIQLLEMANEPDYGWVTRHTWQSWRERYKKNSTRLDFRIAAIVAQKKPVIGEKGQYGYVRAPEGKPKRPRKKPQPKLETPGPSNLNHNGIGGGLGEEEEWDVGAVGPELGPGRVGQLRVIQEGYPLVPVHGNGHGQPYPQAHLHPPHPMQELPPIQPPPPHGPGAMLPHPHHPHHQQPQPNHPHPLQPLPETKHFFEYLHTPGRLPAPPNGPPSHPPTPINNANTSANADATAATGPEPSMKKTEDGADTDEEWQVRVGTAPPPPWAINKRKNSEEEEEARKRQRPNYCNNSDAATSTSSTRCLMNPQPPRINHPPNGHTNGHHPSSNVHVVDQTLRDIAAESRFTIEEVQEYYDRCGEMEKTRERFRRMRDELRRLFQD
ncbi:hypothetical protein JAAARDRAFT_53966 [Jaapia argillacea MUCL 33604]|uniref:DNA-binding protein RAP1 n=1 Tax=Jaapia argillacea MUCL 33604 TaxID=933084 RepID=A0A067QJS2_9AGAM|nr:hypothetical protein JAAARDRAFT_53966 [Jaapia argillacea MUCL 33604]